MLPQFRLHSKLFTSLAAVAVALVLNTPTGAIAQVTAFKQAVAETASRDKALSAFYKAVKFDGIWTGNDDRTRRQALMAALATASDHGLPASRYKADELMAAMKAAKTPTERGKLEVEMSRVFLQFARDIQTGALIPSQVDSGIVRNIPYRDRASYLTTLVKSNPSKFFRALAPKTNEYARLMKEKLRLEKALANGGWGQTVPAKSLKPGQSGNSVVILRNRLMAMGYMDRSSTQSYDGAVQKAVQQFQVDHGLNPDGEAGAGTMVEINRSMESRLQSIIVAMERERWLNIPRGGRHVLVNLTDFSAKIVDNDIVTFTTRSVVGANDADRRSPEFSDVMEFLVINPTWNVPRSIAVKEYLPMMKRNPNAAGHLQLYDGSGRKVSRSNINFSQYSESSFPFDIKQPPSRRNALGLVKFMFPNRYNIYLHDTPAKALFDRESRAFSHGCIRLHQPFEFAYALLARQESDPEAYFQSILKTGSETAVQLKQHVPVHIDYRTAFTQAKGRTNYRRDVYGRDAKIWRALSNAGVALRAVQG